MLISSLLLAIILPQQDSFLSEFGERYDLDGAHPFPNPEVGVVVCRFNFQSSIQDITTGQYIVPDYSFAYSLQEDGVNPAIYTAAGHLWVFGGPFLAPPEQVISFDSATGAGEAKAFLPLDLVAPQHFWGQPPLGRSWMTVYWGVGEEVTHDGLNPPALAQGNKVMQLDTFFPSVSILLHENHALVMDQESTLGIVASSIETFDRVFTLSVVDPGYIDLPQSIVIPAGAQSATAGLVPRQVGMTRVLAISSSYSGVVFRSQKAEIRPPVVIVPLGSAPDPPGIGAIMPNRYCVHTNPSTPNGGPDGAPGTTNLVCGGCAASSLQDVCPISLGSVVGCYEPYRCPATLMDTCDENTSGAPYVLGDWELIDKWTEKCDLSGWSAVASWFWDIDKYRICCKFERLGTDSTQYLKDCH